MRARHGSTQLRRKTRPCVLGLESRLLLSLDAGLSPSALVASPGDSAIDPAYRGVSIQLQKTALTVRAGETVTNQVTATPSRPGIIITYALDPSSPQLSMLDTRTGAFSWTPTPDMARADSNTPAVYTVTIRAVENSPEAPFTIASFDVRVLPAKASTPVSDPSSSPPTTDDTAVVATDAQAHARIRHLTRRANTQVRRGTSAARRRSPQRPQTARIAIVRRGLPPHHATHGSLNGNGTTS